MPNAETAALILALRNLMKEKHVIYRDLVGVLELSESSIKRIFSRKTMTVEQLTRVSNRLGHSFFELCEFAARKFVPSHLYTPAQDRLLGQSPLAMCIFVRLLFGHSPAEIQNHLGLSAKEVLAVLVKLDKVDLIALHRSNRVLVKVRGPFRFPKGGSLDESLKNHLKVILGHFQKKPATQDAFAGLLHAREFYLPEDMYEQLRAEAMALSVKYRQISSWMVHERKTSELKPVTLLLGLDHFDAFQAVWRASLAKP